MRDINDKIEGHFFIDEDLIFRGLMTNGATVRHDCCLDLKGMVVGTLTVESGGRALIHGMVTGAVVNHGHAEIFGTVKAVVNASSTAITLVDAAANITG